MSAGSRSKTAAAGRRLEHLADRLAAPGQPLEQDPRFRIGEGREGRELDGERARARRSAICRVFPSRNVPAKSSVKITGTPTSTDGIPTSAATSAAILAARSAPGLEIAALPLATSQSHPLFSCPDVSPTRFRSNHWETP